MRDGPPSSAPADGGRGILWMLLTVLLFSCANVVIKTLALAYPIPQLLWVRMTVSGVVIALLIGRRLPRAIASRRPGIQILRSVLMLLGSALVFVTLHLLPLAEASAVLLLSPILVTALAVPILGEAVEVRRWVAVVAGFVGALIVVRPGADVFQLAVVVPLTAAAAQGLFEVNTRLLSRSDSVLTTALYTCLVGAVVTSAALPFFWMTPGWVDGALMGGLAVITVASQFTLIKAYEAAPAPTVAPYQYSILIWATLFGFVFFGDLPNLWTVVGAATITASGLYLYLVQPAAADGRRATGAGPSP